MGRAGLGVIVLHTNKYCRRNDTGIDNLSVVVKVAGSRAAQVEMQKS